MFKRYDLNVFCGEHLVYSANFSSINLLVKFACGFNRNICELDANDVVFEHSVPLEELCKEFENERNGI